MPIRIQTHDFDLSTEVAALRASNRSVGAICTFTGTVRDRNDGSSVAEMELEHYPGMTEKALEDIVAQARARWDIIDALVIHRIGPMKPLDQIVLVAVTSAHRGESFAACEFIMDFLKTDAPFWKKEQTPDGARWVDARVTDDRAREKWGNGGGAAGAPTAPQSVPTAPAAEPDDAGSAGHSGNAEKSA